MPPKNKICKFEIRAARQPRWHEKLRWRKKKRWRKNFNQNSKSGFSSKNIQTSSKKHRQLGNVF
ncbi:hypothetical protein AUJ29_02285 [Candidatus Kuenenbacteria bacterium CG1_02_38_13]|uniref:Uncharacterized protein n=1 Tax=Candidatus Kuenenbacteria bacterium CG1_02_38_13 TaxID=1805235 RepID=A0A1J4U0L9_9BACT|nr:MAG: hypothetical protein AUJ29_02285 [Candidatus Kuenenbacteria bacterium CG1_02_38_13]